MNLLVASEADFSSKELNGLISQLISCIIHPENLLFLSEVVRYMFGRFLNDS
jgi:hypothetical protein